MKTLHTIACTLLIAFTASISLQAEEQTPIIPVGSLSAFPTIVQTGTHPQLTWEITVPETIDDVVDIIPPGTLNPKRCLIMDVRVLGASVKRVWINSWGQIVQWEWVPTEARVSYNGGSYDQIFFDTHDDVNPNYIVHSQKVEKNSTVNFGARYMNSNGSWANWYSSTNSTHNVVALRNGDTPPTTTPLYDQPSIESFLLPYLDDNGNVKLGARDIIYLMELTHTDRNHGGFDLQDMALLITFYDKVETPQGTVDCNGNLIEPTPPPPSDDSGNGNNGNNGHGNNIDGVDSSNPGNSKAGEDTDPNVDDERDRGRRNR